MSYRCEIFTEQRLIALRYRGPYDLSRLKTTIEGLWADGRYSPDFDGVVDLTDRNLSLPFDELGRFMGFLSRDERTTRGRWAALVGSPFTTACAMLYRRMMAPRHALEVFSTRNAACEYLARDPEEVRISWWQENAWDM